MKFLCLIISLIFINNFSLASIEKIKERGYLRVGVFIDKAPFGYFDKDGKAKGFDVEIAKFLAKDLFGDEDKIVFVETHASDRVAFLKSGNVDVILANFTNTKRRAKAVDFAKPYMKVALGVISKGGIIKSIDDLKGKNLIVNTGTTAEEYFNKISEIKKLSYLHNNMAFKALEKGEGDALAHDNIFLLAWAKDKKDFELGIPTIGDIDFIAAAVKKGDKSLLTWVNSEMDLIKKDGRLLQAYKETLLPVYGDKISASELLAE